jgi:hypothetical protein
MSFETEIGAVIPKQDLNGDDITLVARDDIFRLLWGVIAPIQERFVAVEHDPAYPRDLWLSQHEEVQAGRATLTADLNTDEGRAAFLQCWWPKDADGVCICWTAQRGKDTELPYPSFSQIRSATILLRLAPDQVFGTMRFGVFPVTTTGLRACYDVGIRRGLWHPTDGLDVWLATQGAKSRLVPLPAKDPLRTWTYSPGHTEEKANAYTAVLSRRPVADLYLDWLKGQP